MASVLLDDSSGSQKNLKDRAKEIFPALVLLVSGGHSQILVTDENLSARQWADTADDSAGECFDKIAKILGLGYPGGPEIEKRAARLTDLADLETARQLAKELPRPKSEVGFSFSGLKTAARLLIERRQDLREKPEIFCHAFQEVIADTLKRNLLAALEKIPEKEKLKSFVVCGGVSANKRIREVLQEEMKRRGLKSYFPPLKLCTDNAAMIAAAAWVQDPSLDLKDVSARIPL
jgi:N6-L-threonylcarbamoyladenine synthase